MRTDIGSGSSTETHRARPVDMKFEVVVIPVSDIDRGQTGVELPT